MVCPCLSSRRREADERLLAIIADYLEEVAMATRELQARVPSVTATFRHHGTAGRPVALLSAVRGGDLPRHGELGPGATYSFHGIGCEIRRADAIIDFDFAPDGEADAFDAHRLHRFTAGTRSDALGDEARIARGLARLRRAGLITAIPGTQQYRLAPAARQRPVRGAGG
jgi:hypothetical protein